MTSFTSDSWTVVKVGGSLYDLPDLRLRLGAWLDQLAAAKILLLPGGGATADAVRTLDRVHQLGEDAAHWLALRALSLNAHFLHALLPAAPIIADIPAESKSRCHILDAYPFFVADDFRNDHLPHDWQVTSDSLAVRAAVLIGAGELVLLKSTSWQGTDWAEASRANIVDGHFSQAMTQTAVTTLIVNLRSWRIPG